MPVSPTRIDAPAFLTALRAAGIVPPKALDRAAAVGHESADAVADSLVQAGTITRYQADRLLAGRGDGFHLGQYVVLEPLGKASEAGRVYKARHRTMNRLVAVKVLSAARTATPAAKQAFVTEARAAAKLAHPNVVTVLDANEAAGRCYLVLEYVDGPSLEDLIAQNGPPPLPRLCDWLRQAALGLAHAHERNMPHGRFGPADCLVGRVGGVGPAAAVGVKVTNFALAKIAAAEAPADAGGLHAAAAATDYLAPEQFTDPAGLSPAADLYSLGCTAYFACTGRAPAPDGDGLLHQFERAVPLAKLRPDLPPPLLDLVGRLMAREPADRPASAAEVAAVLAHYADAGEGRVEFPLPRPAPHHSDGGFLNGLPAPGPGRESSPFADLDDDRPTPDAFRTATPISTRLPRRRPPSPVWIPVVISAIVLLATGGAFVLALKMLK